MEEGKEQGAGFSGEQQSGQQFDIPLEHIKQSKLFQKFLNQEKLSSSDKKSVREITYNPDGNDNQERASHQSNKQNSISYHQANNSQIQPEQNCAQLNSSLLSRNAQLHPSEANQEAQFQNNSSNANNLREQYYSGSSSKKQAQSYLAYQQQPQPQIPYQYEQEGSFNSNPQGNEGARSRYQSGRQKSNGSPQMLPSNQGINYASVGEGERELEGYSQLITDQNNFNVNAVKQEKVITPPISQALYANNYLADPIRKEFDYSASANLPNDVYELKKWIIDLRNDLEKQKQLNKGLEQQNEEYKFMQDKMVKNFQDFKFRTINETQANKSNLLNYEDNLSNLQEKIFSLQKNEELLQLENEKLKNKLLNEQMLRSKNEEESREQQFKIDEMNDQINEKQRKIDLLTQDAERCNQIIEQQKMKIVALQTSIDKSQASFKEQQQNLQKDITEQQNQQKLVNDLQEKYQKQFLENEKLRQDLHVVNSQKQQLEFDMENMKNEQITQKQLQIENSQKEINLGIQLDKKNIEITKLKGLISIMENDLVKLRDYNSSLQGQIEQISQQPSQFVHPISEQERYPLLNQPYLDAVSQKQQQQLPATQQRQLHEDWQSPPRPNKSNLQSFQNTPPLKTSDPKSSQQNYYLQQGTRNQKSTIQDCLKQDSGQPEKQKQASKSFIAQYQESVSQNQQQAPTQVQTQQHQRQQHNVFPQQQAQSVEENNPYQEYLKRKEKFTLHNYLQNENDTLAPEQNQLNQRMGQYSQGGKVQQPQQGQQTPDKVSAYQNQLANASQNLLPNQSANPAKAQQEQVQNVQADRQLQIQVIEGQLLQMNLKKQDLSNELKKLENTKQKKVETIKRKNEIANELKQIDQALSSLKQQLRQKNALYSY